MKSITYIQHDVDGRVVSCTSTVAASEDSIKPRRPGLFIKFVADSCAPNEVYWDGSKVVPKPPAPTPSHDFNYTTKQWVANTDKAWEAARQRRSSLLMQTDWRVTKALETGDTLAQDWLDYRQALRDITLQTDPLALVWPVEPG